MLSNIFVKVAPLLKERQYNIDNDLIIGFLGKYKPKQFIYPSAMHRELKIEIKSVYEILELCVRLGLVEQWLEIYCPNCKRFTGQCFKTVEEIPEEVYCLNCDEEIILHPLKHALVVYKVL